KKIYAMLQRRERSTSPFRNATRDEPATPRVSVHFVEPELVAEVRFTEWTDSGGIRQPSFLGMIEDADPRQCTYDGPQGSDSRAEPVMDDNLGIRGIAIQEAATGTPKVEPKTATITNPEKIFWPREGYTKGDLVAY